MRRCPVVFSVPLVDVSPSQFINELAKRHHITPVVVALFVVIAVLFSRSEGEFSRMFIALWVIFVRKCCGFPGSLMYIAKSKPEKFN